MLSTAVGRLYEKFKKFCRCSDSLDSDFNDKNSPHNLDNKRDLVYCTVSPASVYSLLVDNTDPTPGNPNVEIRTNKYR